MLRSSRASAGRTAPGAQSVASQLFALDRALGARRLRKSAVGQRVLRQPRREVRGQRDFASPPSGARPASARARGSGTAVGAQGVRRIGQDDRTAQVCCAPRVRRTAPHYILRHGATGEVRPLGRRRGGAPRAAPHLLAGQGVRGRDGDQRRRRRRDGSTPAVQPRAARRADAGQARARRAPRAPRGRSEPRDRHGHEERRRLDHDRGARQRARGLPRQAGHAAAGLRRGHAAARGPAHPAAGRRAALRRPLPRAAERAAPRISTGASGSTATAS